MDVIRSQPSQPAQIPMQSLGQFQPMIQNCPPGLQYLAMLDQILVHQKIELLEVMLGCETRNKYDIKNSMGQIFYYAEEDTDFCTRICCGPIRPFDMRIVDNTGLEVIHLLRPLACDSCCCPCCLQELEVFGSGSIKLGTVKQEWSILTPKFIIENAAGECVLRIEGPICVCRCIDVEFEVLTADGSAKVGKITKQWGGLVRELFTDADHFGISFPMNLDVSIKAVLLGACFLIDYMYFETPKNN